jgi:hypothetical protein
MAAKKESWGKNSMARETVHSQMQGRLACFASSTRGEKERDKKMEFEKKRASKHSWKKKENKHRK